MSATFNERQLIIGETAIAEVLVQYPALCRPVIVSWYYYRCTFFITIYIYMYSLSMNFALIISKEDARPKSELSSCDDANE